MKKIILCCGIPASGKSTWAKKEIENNPNSSMRISRDDLRNMLHNYHLSDENERIITKISNSILKMGLLSNTINLIILDNTNANRRNFDDICKMVKEMNIDCMVMEKSFFVELNESIARDAKREGTAKVGEDIVRKFWKKLGGNQHQFYKPRMEIFNRQTLQSIEATVPKFDASKKPAIICDLDGTISLFNVKKSDGSVEVRYPNVHVRDPYNAATCDEDSVNEPVAEVVELLSQAGYKIIFCSGREDSYRGPTERFLKKHLSTDYELHMRKSGDMRKDSIIKEEIYVTHIEPFYNTFLVLDDRSQVIDLWRRKLGLVAFQVAYGDF